ncbi:MAG: hypothetical protein H6602_04630 [Flavobacteriales bacterium]|nr:hypothetical protein [Flavobacteriales bacterium]
MSNFKIHKISAWLLSVCLLVSIQAQGQAGVSGLCKVVEQLEGFNQRYEAFLVAPNDSLFDTQTQAEFKDQMDQILQQAEALSFNPTFRPKYFHTVLRSLPVLVAFRDEVALFSWSVFRKMETQLIFGEGEEKLKAIDNLNRKTVLVWLEGNDLIRLKSKFKAIQQVEHQLRNILPLKWRQNNCCNCP